MEIPEFTIRDNIGLFWLRTSPFSQWYPCKFEVDKVVYNCAEQYMMAGKARLFGDADALANIMATNNPKRQKDIGRMVERFDAATWEKHAVPIVTDGTIAKFSQNIDLWRYLDATGTLMLAEASPFDRTWGIGLAATHPDASHPAKWTGRNQLGDVLVRVRSALRLIEKDATHD